MLGYIDRSSVAAQQGPIDFVEGKTGIWTCETGVLPGHQPDAIAKLVQYFPAFQNGDFKKLLSYVRPNGGKPSENDL